MMPNRPVYDQEPVYEIEEHSDHLNGMLAGATLDSRRRAASVRAHLKSTLRGPELRAALDAARSNAKADMAGTKAAIRMNFGYARGRKRRKKIADLLIAKAG